MGIRSKFNRFWPINWSNVNIFEWDQLYIKDKPTLCNLWLNISWNVNTKVKKLPKRNKISYISVCDKHTIDFTKKPKVFQFSIFSSEIFQDRRRIATKPYLYAQIFTWRPNSDFFQANFGIWPPNCFKGLLKKSGLLIRSCVNCTPILKISPKSLIWVNCAFIANQDIGNFVPFWQFFFTLVLTFQLIFSYR